MTMTSAVRDDPTTLVTVPHWIGGEEVVEQDAEVLDVFDPSTGQVHARVGVASDHLVRQVTEAATAAARRWGEASVARRVEVLFEFRNILRVRQDALCEAISVEHGKSSADALGEVKRGIEAVEFACGIPHLLKGDSSENVSSNVDLMSIRQPLGVVVGITPFNFPVMVPLWMVPVAIATGNAFVLKPSERVPSAALLLTRWASEAGLPPHVFNVLHGDGRVAEALIADPRVSAISSVGSTRVARHIYEAASAQGKRVQALGGAKNHAVVMPDVDLEAVATALIGAAFGSTGQRCMAVSAVVAVDGVADELVQALVDRMADLRVGSWTDPATDIGPLISGQQRDRVLRLVREGVEAGATLVVNGSEIAVDNHEEGYFVGPCLFDHVTPSMSIYQEEIFGPVLVIIRVANLAEAIGFINDNLYGNGSVIFTDDGPTARRFVHEISAGMVGVNIPIPVPSAHYSFGGWKASLFGDHDIYGPDAVRFYTRVKTVTSRWQPLGRKVDVAFPGSRK